jgi:hypothetical protein
MASLAMEQYLRNLIRDHKTKHKMNNTRRQDEFSCSSGSSHSESSSVCSKSGNHDDDDYNDDEASFSCENLTVVVDNAHLPVHCFFANASSWNEVDNDEPMVALSQSLSAISTLSFPPAFLLQQQSNCSSSRWSCDESQSSGLDLSLIVPSRSRDCDSPLWNARRKSANSTTATTTTYADHTLPPTKTASLDSTTKWLRELPVDPPQTSSLRRRGGTRGVDTPLKCPKSRGGEYQELPSLIECQYCDEGLDIHPQQLGSLDGLKNKHVVATLSCAMRVLKSEDERETNRRNIENEVLHFSDDEDEILLGFSDDEGEEKYGKEDEAGEDEPPKASVEQPEDEREDCSYQSVRNDREGSSGGLNLVNFELSSPTPTKMEMTIRRSPLLSHTSPRGIGDFPYTSSPIVFQKGDETMVTHNSASTKSPSSGSSSSSSSSASSPSVLNRHLQLTKKLSVVFEQEEIERFVELTV